MIDFKIKERIHLNKKQYCYCNLDDMPLNDEWYDDAWRFKNGFARVKKNGLGWNFINNKGQYLTNEWYNWVDEFKYGFAVVEKKGLGYSFINTEGKYLINEWYNWVWNFENGFAMVKKKDLGFNFIKPDGTYLTNDWYDNIWNFSEGFARVYKKSLGYNFINTGGTLLLGDWYDYARNFCEGFAVVQKLGLGYSFINTEGKRINDDWYDWAGNFYNGFAKVYKTEEDYDNDDFYYLCTDGKLYISNKVNNKMTKEQAREYLTQKKFRVSNITEARNVARFLKNLDIDILLCFMYGFTETLMPFYYETEDEYKEDDYEEITPQDILSIEIVEEETEPVEKFDFSTLKPFDKVLVKYDGIWHCDFFSHKNGDEFHCVGMTINDCIPFNEETQHLVGTKQEEPAKYKQ